MFLHGITPDMTPQPPWASYQVLRQAIIRENKGVDPFAGRYLYAEWGFKSGAALPLRTAALAEVEEKIEALITLGSSRKIDWANPVNAGIRLLVTHGLRRLFIYGFADMFYYVSEEGKKAVRADVFDQLLTQFGDFLDQGHKLSLTIFAHSAGSVIAHDLLFHLFSAAKDRKKLPQRHLESKLDKLRANAGTSIRVRKFYTMGSPLAQLMVRSERLITMINKRQKIPTDNLGLTSPGIDNPRWVNFWDEDDMISAPIAEFYNNSPGEIVVDSYPDVGDFPLTAHNLYWGNAAVARTIVQTW